MIDRKTVLAVIPARGGSKGVPRKNLRMLAGKPLICHTIDQARASALIDRVIVDTDDPEIAAVSRVSGADVPFLRVASLATDDAPVVDSLIALIERIDVQCGYLVMLQCTSPMRTSGDIDAAMELCADSGAPACVSVSIVSKPPYWMLEVGEGGRIKPLTGWDGFQKRRQDLADTYLPNGAIYIAEIPWFRQNRKFYGPDTMAYVMAAARSIDIDTEEDFLIAHALLAARSANRGESR